MPTYPNTIETCLRLGRVSRGDFFRSLPEVGRLFPGGIKRQQFKNRANIDGRDGEFCFFPKERGSNGWSNEREFGPNIDGRGWPEVLVIREYNENPQCIRECIKWDLDHPVRHVFWHEGNEYIFLGTFEVDADATNATLSTARPCIINHRTSETLEL